MQRWGGADLPGVRRIPGPSPVERDLNGVRWRGGRIRPRDCGARARASARGAGIGWLQSSWRSAYPSKSVVPEPTSTSARCASYGRQRKRLSMDDSYPSKLCIAGRSPNKSVPIIVGGHSEAAARRAGRLGDRFFPYTREQVKLIAIARESAGRAGRDPNKLETTTSLPSDAAELEALQRLGVRRVLVPLIGGGR